MNYLVIFILCMPILAAAEVLTDPTRPYGYGAAPAIVIQDIELPREQINWRLTGIRIAEQDKSVILNGKLAREGDIVDGASINEIEPAAVVIDFEDKQIRVNLLRLNVKANERAESNYESDERSRAGFTAAAGVEPAQADARQNPDTARTVQ